MRKERPSSQYWITNSNSKIYFSMHSLVSPLTASFRTLAELQYRIDKEKREKEGLFGGLYSPSASRQASWGAIGDWFSNEPSLSSYGMSEKREGGEKRRPSLFSSLDKSLFSEEDWKELYQAIEFNENDSTFKAPAEVVCFTHFFYL